MNTFFHHKLSYRASAKPARDKIANWLGISQRVLSLGVFWPNIFRRQTVNFVKKLTKTKIFSWKSSKNSPVFDNFEKTDHYWKIMVLPFSVIQNCVLKNVGNSIQCTAKGLKFNYVQCGRNRGFKFRQQQSIVFQLWLTKGNLCLTPSFFLKTLYRCHQNAIEWKRQDH